MNRNTKLTAFALLPVLAAAAFAPTPANASQSTKNTWRNLALGSAAVAGYGLLKHNNTATILGAVGTAYSANRYEKDRHNQSVESSNRRARYHRSTQYNNTRSYTTHSNTTHTPRGHAYGYWKHHKH